MVTTHWKDGELILEDEGALHDDVVDGNEVWEQWGRWAMRPWRYKGGGCGAWVIAEGEEDMDTVMKDSVEKKWVVTKDN